MPTLDFLFVRSTSCNLTAKCGISKKAADEKAKEIFDIYAQKRRRLKETEGERANIAALKDLLKKGK